MMIVRNKRKTILASLFLAFFMVSGQALSLTVSDVGELDLFLDSTLLENSGDAEEIAWIEGTILAVDNIAVDVTITEKIEIVEDITDPLYNLDLIMAVDDDPLDPTPLTDDYAIVIDPTTDYYVIKIGCAQNGTCDADTYLFENIADLTYAYFTLDSLLIDNITTISHITATVSAVPIPTAAWLFGSAMLGLVGVARRKTA